MVDVSINSSLFIQILNFFILMIALNHFLLKPVVKILGERRAFFQNLEQEGDTAKLMIEEGEAKMERHKVEILSEGASVLGKLKDEGRAQERELLEKTQREANARIEEARANLGAELEAARTQLRSDANVLAKSMVESVLGRKLGPAS